MENAIIEDIALVEEVQQIEDPAVVAGSQEFKDYDKEQKAINAFLVFLLSIKTEILISDVEIT